MGGMGGMGSMGGMLGMSQMGMSMQYPNNGWDQGHNPNPNGKNGKNSNRGGWGEDRRGGGRQRNQERNQGSAVGPPGLEKAPSRQAQTPAQRAPVEPAVVKTPIMGSESTAESAAPTVDSDSSAMSSVMDILNERSDDAATV